MTSSLRVFVPAFLLFIGLFGLASALVVWADQRVERARDHSAAAAAVAEAARQVQAFVRLEAGNVRVIAQDMAVLEFANGDETVRPLVEREFSVFMAEKPAIAQLRVMNLDGRETVRVDRVGSRIVTADDSALQDKSARYYFSDAVGLPPNGVYLSELDLNVERGVVETPWRPMLRLAAPIPGPDGTTAALVVMNLDAGFLIDTVERLRFADGRSVALLNGAGYWLAGASPDRRWGFMFGKDTSLASSDPDLWRRIEAIGSGGFSVDDTDYIVDTVRPAEVLTQAHAGLDIYLAAESWILLAGVPGQVTTPVWIGWPRTLVVLTLSSILAWLVAGLLTARRRAEQRRLMAEVELVRADRLAGLGSIVAGVAHELNTPLGNAKTVASTLTERLDELEAQMAASGRPASVDEAMRDIRDGTGLVLKNVTRAAEIVRQFREVSTDQVGERRREFRLDDFLRDMVHIHSPQFRGTGIVLECEGRAATPLDSYPGPLGQVVSNLIANARIHAFAPGEQGRVIVTCRELSGGFFELVVRDTGKGMAPAVSKRIFDPFFTTRLGADGSGMGMAIVHRIVTGILGGEIAVTSRPGAGTSVVVRLPRQAPTLKTGNQLSEYDVRRN
ncbi:sensor histidine kinase [Amorphus coralli]|uniref:sensor histidine kinase n=1 Tax=Amorphus coralli TaxID=340680 RepID=UPI00035F4C93